MFSEFKYWIPMLFISYGTLAVGVIPALFAWAIFIKQWLGTGQRTTPKALCALTASICVTTAGFNVYMYHQDPLWTWHNLNIHQIWFVIFAIGFLLNLAALILASERSAARVAVLIGSLGVAVVQSLGLAWFFWGS